MVQHFFFSFRHNTTVGYSPRALRYFCPGDTRKNISSWKHGKVLVQLLEGNRCFGFSIILGICSGSLGLVFSGSFLVQHSERAVRVCDSGSSHFVLSVLIRYRMFERRKTTSQYFWRIEDHVSRDLLLCCSSVCGSCSGDLYDVGFVSM